MADIKRFFPMGTAAIFLVWLVLVGAAFLWWHASVKSLSPELKAVMRLEPRTLQPFALVDQQERPFSEAQLKDKWTFLFFGYTYCPDICPTTLVLLKQTMELLQQHEADARNVQVVFVSVDPERDTPEVMRRYLDYFDKRFIGATGRTSQIDALASQVGAGYRKEPPEGSGQYLISHSASIFLINPLGQLVAAFSPPLYADTIANLFQELRSFY